MKGFGFGYRFSRRAASTGNTVPVTEVITQFGVTFRFAAPRPAGQYANGDWWVLGPVSMTSITPASDIQTDAIDGNGTAIAHRVVNGTMVNPGNRAFAPGGLAANNTSNTLQSFDTLANGVSNMVYEPVHNVDPGATGSALIVATGSVMKFVSRLTGLPLNNRPAGTDMVVLTVVDAIPAPYAIRPGVSRSGNKASPCRLSDFNLDVFQSLAPTANAPTFEQALAWVGRYIEVAFPDSINNTGAKGANNHPEYGRDIGNNVHRALLSLHLSSFTAQQKRTLLSQMAAIADDLVGRAEEGAITLGAGGGNSWKLPLIVVCAASLGAKTPASWTTYLSGAQRMVWAENRQMFRVSSADIALPRYTADGRPRTAYTQQMLGSAEWGEAGAAQPERSGSNWNASYRDIVAYSLYPGALAIELTAGAKALWDHPEFWLYMETVFLRRSEGSSGNKLLPFALEMANAYRPAKTSMPAIMAAGVKDTAVWVRFDQALDETASLPPASDFTVSVNGLPRAISSVSIWRQNLGLTLTAPVTGNDAVTLGYARTINPVRNVDRVNIANMTAQPLTNQTDKVGGPNAAYPVVRFSPGVQRTIAGTNTLASANSAFGTIALLKFRFSALPATLSEFMGNASGAPGLRLFLNVNGSVEIRIANASGITAARAFTTPLMPNVDYDILWSVDMSQATSSAGINCYVNGSANALGVTTWTGGAGVVAGWSRGGIYRWNFSNNMTFDLGAFWLDATSRIDLTHAANRDKFFSVTQGNLDILTRGDGITGSVPAQFLVGNAEQWNDGAGINRGTGNKWFVSSGLTTTINGNEWI